MEPRAALIVLPCVRNLHRGRSIYTFGGKTGGKVNEFVVYFDCDEFDTLENRVITSG